MKFYVLYNHEHSKLCIIQPIRDFICGLRLPVVEFMKRNAYNRKQWKARADDAALA
jgi:hypothetical protein